MNASNKTMLTKNFSLEEMCVTHQKDKDGNTLPNLPHQVTEKDLAEHIVDNLKFLCEEFLQPLRDEFVVPIKINSGFRSADVNKAAGGARNSLHLVGLAADIRCRSLREATKFFDFFWRRSMQCHSYHELIICYRPKTKAYWLHLSSFRDPQNNKLKDVMMVYK